MCEYTAHPLLVLVYLTAQLDQSLACEQNSWALLKAKGFGRVCLLLSVSEPCVYVGVCFTVYAMYDFWWSALAGLAIEATAVTPVSTATVNFLSTLVIRLPAHLCVSKLTQQNR